MIIYVSPSAQDKNTGVAGYGSEEQRMNQIADVVCPLLQYNGFTVYRNKPEMTLEQLVADSNAHNPDVHLSIHSNAGGGKGTEVYYYEGSADSKRLAECLYDNVAPLTPSQDRGVKSGNQLYELNSTSAVAAIIEVAFHDNVDDATFIMNNVPALGKAIAKAVCQYAGVTYKEPQQDNELETLKKKIADMQHELDNANARGLVAERGLQQLTDKYSKLIQSLKIIKTFMEG